MGRPSIPPEQWLRAQLLQMLYSLRSGRLWMEEMDYNILFRWFVGLNWDDAVWDATCTAGRSAARQNNLKSPQGPKKTRTEMACST